MFEEVKERWNAEQACVMYRKLKAKLNKFSPILARQKRKSHLVCEDNDPSGFKCNRAKVLKRQIGLSILSLPTFSPDLMPLDYSLWRQIEAKARSRVAADDRITGAEYKRILKTAALRLSPKAVEKTVAAMHGRVKDIVAAKGGHIACD